jgi:hypothetical protein
MLANNRLQRTAANRSEPSVLQVMQLAAFTESGKARNTDIKQREEKHKLSITIN